MDQESCCNSPSMTTWPINSPLLSLPLKETTDRRLRGSGANPATKRQCRPQMAPTRLRRPSLPMQEGSWLRMQDQFDWTSRPTITNCKFAIASTLSILHGSNDSSPTADVVSLVRTSGFGPIAPAPDIMGPMGAIGPIGPIGPVVPMAPGKGLTSCSLSKVL